MEMNHMVFTCPYCKKVLKENEKLYCPPCEKTFPIVDGIPDFLPERIAPERKKLLNFVDKLPSIYETSLWYPLIYHLYGGLFIPSVKEEIKIVTDMLGVDGGTALDVACGTGMFTRSIAQKAQHCYGIDMSMRMLRKAQKYAQKKGLHNITMVRAEVEHIPLPPELFDGVSCCGALHLFPDVEGALREMNRVLKKGGKLVVMTFIRRRFLKVKRIYEHLDEEHGTHIFEVGELESYLKNTGYTNFAYKIYGSMILFEAVKF
ncbi:MAG: methyltransferase domain-containing protein [Theionarchaea archaeon]|nr:methyltransferase domain-containing protein [Theionarchaea archaeon]